MWYWDMWDIYLGFKPLSSKKAAHYLAGFGWLIDHFAAHYDMPNTVFYPYSEESFLAAAPPLQQQASEKWIDEQFTALRTFAKLTHIPMSFKPQPDILPTYDTNKTQQTQLTEKYAGASDEKYYVEDHGIPVIYYRQDLVCKPGYIQKRIVERLANMLHKTAPKPKLISSIPNKDLTILCGAFMGLGHAFCAGRATPEQETCTKDNDNIAAFALATFFHLKGLGQGQAIEAYGKYLSEQTKHDLTSAYRQLIMNRTLINALREKLNPIICKKRA